MFRNLSILHKGGLLRYATRPQGVGATLGKLPQPVRLFASGAASAPLSFKSKFERPRVSFLHDKKARREFEFLKHRQLNLAEQEADRSAFARSRQLPDFADVEPALQGMATRRLRITEDMSKKKHPLEYLAEDLRTRENPYTRLGESSLLLTNFPKGVEVTK